eukprot:403164-Rhodomonas_salina.1
MLREAVERSCVRVWRVLGRNVGEHYSSRRVCARADCQVPRCRVLQERQVRRYAGSCPGSRCGSGSVRCLACGADCRLTAAGRADNGGYCTDTTIYDKDECECPQRDADRNCLQTDNKWTSVTGSLVTTGEVFNPFGYALIFPRAEQVPAKHVGFSQA